MAVSPSIRMLRMVLWGGVLVAGIAATWTLLPGPPPSQQVTDTIGQGDYRLMTTGGAPFTAENLKGKPSLVFFGFTHCPDVCPTTLGDIMGWQEALGPLGQDLGIFFITVDPERDTVATLSEYISWLPHAQGVTGTVAEVERALKAFKIYAKKVPLEGSDYSMDHSAYVMLFDEGGRYNQIFSYQEDPERVVAKLRRFLEARG